MRLLNIGCGPASLALPPYYDDWEVVRLDIDPVHQPNILMDALDVGELAGEDYDAAYASHLIEHIYVWELERFLVGCYQALAPDGYLQLRVPDALAACRAAAKAGTLDAVCYHSAVGDVTAWDMLYGHAAYQHQFHEPMAHHNGFEQDTLTATLQLYGLRQVYIARNEWEMMAIGCKTDLSPQMKERIGLGRATGNRPVHPDGGTTDVATVRQLRPMAELPLCQPSRRARGRYPTTTPAAGGRGAKLPGGAGVSGGL